MCEEISFNKYIAMQFFQELLKTDLTKSLTEKEAMDYLRPVTFNDELNASWLSANVKNVSGLVRVLIKVLES